MRIGLEIHVQLPTKSKMFCSCPTTHSEEPNTNVCPTCLGMPGSRPSLNKAAVEAGLKIAKMFNCNIPEKTWFSRKTYFYPDLAKHFQITQYDCPIGEKGKYEMKGKIIRITRVHLEEDPGKTKRVGDGSSLIDYNRSGIPLVEIVTEPDISSPAEARAFLSELLVGIRHIVDIPEDGDRSIRVDCNLSVGTERCEVKNVTGLKNVERALMFEAVRQTKVLKAGGKIVRETRRYDEERKVTMPARKKEFEEDYGYIGEPDLGTYYIKEIADSLELKETPAEMAERLHKDYGVDQKMAKQIVNTSIRMAELFEELVKAVDAESAVKWTAGTISSQWRSAESSLTESKDEVKAFASLKKSIISIVSDAENGKMTDVEATNKLKSVMTGKEEIKAAEGSADLDALVEKSLDANPSVLEDYRKNEKALNRIIGAVMKETAGRYSSQQIVEAAERLIKKRL